MNRAVVEEIMRENDEFVKEMGSMGAEEYLDFQYEKVKKKVEEEKKAGLPQKTGYGAFGILRKADRGKHQRGLEKWMEEVKGIKAYSCEKWELEELFEQFQVSFNSASLPHVKYYDYVTWEKEEYTRRSEEKNSEAVGEADKGGKVAGKTIFVADDMFASIFSSKKRVID